MDNLDDIVLRRQLESHHDSAFGWALNCCSYKDAEAKDVLQIAYLKIMDGRAKFKDKSSFKTWLFAVIKITAADERRRGWLRYLGLARFAKERVENEGSESSRHSEEDLAGLRNAMSRLSGRQREVIHLVFYERMTLEDAAALMGVSTGSARTHYERGKANLRRMLEKCEEGGTK